MSTHFGLIASGDEDATGNEMVKEKRASLKEDTREVVAVAKG